MINNCPYCGSENTGKRKRTGYAVIISIFLLGIPFPFMKKYYVCYDCYKEWKKSKNINSDG